MSVGENIKKYRKEKNITQVELSKMINKSVSTIQKYEADSVQPTLNIMKDIAKALECDYADIAITDEDWSKWVDEYEKVDIIKSINGIACMKGMDIKANYEYVMGDQSFSGITIKYKDETFTLTELEYYKLTDRIIESVVINILASKEYK